MSNRFNPAKLEKLNNPVRLKMIPPDYIWEVLSPEFHDEMVEIGAGTGLFSTAFQKLSGRGKTIALDVSDQMIGWMTENITPEYPDVIPMLTDGSILPLENNSADIVFMITLHHELDDKQAMLKEVRRILRKSGKIFIVDWNMSDLEHGPPAEIRCDPYAVADELESAGFCKTKIDNSLASFFLITASAC